MDFVIYENRDIGEPNAYLLLFLHHWMEFSTIFTECLLYIPIVLLLYKSKFYPYQYGGQKVHTIKLLKIAHSFF